jgi:succinyl-CoA synthetase beta subunit
MFRENGFKGGIHEVNNPDEVQEVAKNMCGKVFLSSDIGKQGFLCRCVYISE